jgi:hypothetical protein
LNFPTPSATRSPAFFGRRLMQTATRSLRLAPLKAILATLDPKPRAQPLPPPKPGTPSRVMTRKLR